MAIGSGMSATADLGKAGQIVGAGQTRRCPPLYYHSLICCPSNLILLQILVLAQTADILIAGTLLEQHYQRTEGYLNKYSLAAAVHQEAKTMTIWLTTDSKLPHGSRRILTVSRESPFLLLQVESIPGT